MTTPTDPSRPAAPTVREIAALTARLREITAQGRDVDPAEQAQFLADKDALIARGTATETDRSRAAVRERYEAQDALSAAVRVSAEHPGYVMVGPSARTWLRDPVTGQPAAPVSEQEHRAVRELLNREELDTTDPAWVTGPDGHSNVHSNVYPTPHTDDDAADETGSVDEAGAPDAVVHTFDPADAYTAAEIGALAAAHARGDDAEVTRVEAGRPSLVPDRTAPAGEPVEIAMPEWMREQTRRAEAEIAAGTYEPGAPDDPERIAARLAELRAAAEAAASAAGDEADPGAPGRDDPAWWAPTGPDEVVLTRHEVAAELTGRGFTPEQARAAIAEYLDETSGRIGISVHQWAMDSHDVEAIAHTHHPPVPMPEQRHPSTAEQTTAAEPAPARGEVPPDHAGERDDWEHVRGDDPRTYEQMMGDAAHALTTHRPDRPTDAERDRREQLVRWHTDDTTGGPDRGDNGDVIGSDWDDEPMIFEGRW